MRKISVFLTVSAVIVFLFLAFYERPSISGNIIKETAPPAEIYFCSYDDCVDVLVQMAKRSEKVDCAIYNAKSERFLRILDEKDARLMIDKSYEKNLAGYTIAYRTNSYALMHNKFCVFDDSAIFTGSFNVVDSKDDNNALIVYSKALAKNYADEFDELWNDRYDVKTKNPKVSVNGIIFESYFCPEDWCAERIIDEIKDAKKEVRFMAYSFTHSGIGKELVERREQGIFVSGILDEGQISKWSVYGLLKNNSIDVVSDRRKGLMHHKVFIIDGKTVITGSMNPTENGDTRNDENILIIRSEEAAKYFLEEFERIREK